MMGRGKQMWRNLTTILAVTASLCMVTAGPLFAEEQVEGQADEQTGITMKEKMEAWDVTAGAHADFYSKYIWRGQTLVDDPVFQPGAYIGIKGFTASVWGNYDLNEEKEWTEVDYTLDYSTSLGFIKPELEPVSLSVGYIYYDFPNLDSGDKTQEIYAGVAVDVLLSPSFAVYHDYDEGDGTYYEVGISHSFPLDQLPVENVSLNLGASVGYNDGQWDFDSSFSAALLGAGLTIPLTDHISFEPGIFYSAALDSQYDSEFYAGFSLSIDM